MGSFIRRVKDTLPWAVSGYRQNYPSYDLVHMCRRSFTHNVRTLIIRTGFSIV